MAVQLRTLLLLADVIIAGMKTIEYMLKYDGARAALLQVGEAGAGCTNRHTCIVQKVQEGAGFCWPKLPPWSWVLIAWGS